MYNSLVLKSGLVIWLTTEEANSINQSLLNGDKFFELTRLGQTYNSDQVYYVGFNQIFFNPKVKGGEFRFAPNTVYAKKGENEYAFRGDSWKIEKGIFKTGLSFEEIIKQSSCL